MRHILCHACILRGESARNRELPDLLFVELENEGFTVCCAMAMVMDQGKTNPFVPLVRLLCIRFGVGKSLWNRCLIFWTQLSGMLSSSYAVATISVLQLHIACTTRPRSKHSLRCKRSRTQLAAQRLEWQS
ncbi:TPA: hypothetical protein N0F65_010273 [Lagenidium giganteum]|uniref:Uncharacterized protein n=1 Tax=Lagenidium giganteum TaxID=4803 RepID=A0AAV2YPS2_9STRA|nr:TPA: hypothetical protein N0F65_010273 [Lagenidium giganteum]